MEELHTDRFAELMKEAYLSFAKLSDIGKYFRTYCYRAVQDIDLSLNEIDVLMSLFYAPQKNTVKDISENVCITRGMISQSVESLRRRGLLTVDVNSADRRVLLVALTDAAAPVIAKLTEAESRFTEAILSGIPQDRILKMYDTAEKIHDNKERIRLGDSAE